MEKPRVRLEEEANKEIWERKQPWNAEQGLDVDGRKVKRKGKEQIGMSRSPGFLCKAEVKNKDVAVAEYCCSSSPRKCCQNEQPMELCKESRERKPAG